MKKMMLAAIVLGVTFSAFAQEKKPETLKGVLLEQLRTTHNQKDWFVTVNGAVAGLTAEQASWKDGQGNHSIGELAYHLWFWDKDSLAKFKGEPQPKYSGNNDETFTSFDSKEWAETMRNLDEVMTEWEKAVEAADDAKVKQFASLIAHVGTHNAYHIGQIIYIRKDKGWWNPENGVK